MWTLHGDGTNVKPGAIVLPEERLSWPRTIGFGAQHVVAMFGATFLVPLLTGMPPTTTLFFSGFGTLFFLLITWGRLPSYLGSSFAFIAPVKALVEDGDMGSALFGIMCTGILLALIGALVQITGAAWLDRLMPPVVTGAIVALIGFALAGAATENYGKAPLVATITLAVVCLSAVVLRGFAARLSILFGIIVGYLVALGLGDVSFDKVDKAAWIGLPDFHHPTVDWSVLPMFLPIVLALVAENVGHVRSVAHLTNRPAINRESGRALIADGVATTVAGGFGGSATTTYGENIGVMTATRVFSSAAYVVAGVVAMLLSLSPKFGALLMTIPEGVIGGVTVALYGLIGLIGVRIWSDNHIDFADPVNLYTAAAALIIGIGNLTVARGDVSLSGITLGSIAAIVIYHVMRALQRDPHETVSKDPVDPGA
ncbi:nitrate reductase [Aeromicrobium senzhongii]|uniref:Nitrate reductase n=1 Tax=Aeromicrobium senzhongii TaxID=2663859 RepID=A0ABX6SS36_9ACTN|nr:solute carrier family 23 protein [Aeromicrobium senzhongii]MTB89666.1 nitrate reductase [Aeromicrobium senzhongii]QNL94208.1 nitrate reductase [Aeromicrobium senzhongii]